MTELINSGMVMEAHKFSKFIHGCAVLLPEEVRAAPYWLDDKSLRQSIENSGAGSVLLPPAAFMSIPTTRMCFHMTLTLRDLRRLMK